MRKISPQRGFVVDLMYASRHVPFVSLSRPLDVDAVIAGRAALARPPGWAAIFVKAFALVAKEEPILRTLYAKWPWPHFYELPKSAAMVSIARVENGENCTLIERVAVPEEMPLMEIDAQIRRAKHLPMDQIGSYRRIMKAMAMPLPLRRFSWWVALNVGRMHGNNFGNFGVTSVAAYGPGQLHAISPGPFILSYDVVAPDQSIDVIIRWDHRITDGAPIAGVLTRLEQVLNGEIAAELRKDRQNEPKPVRALGQ